MAKVKAATGGMIRLANELAIRDGRNRSVRPEVVESLGDEIFYPVAFSMVHNDAEMRVGFFDPVGDMILIDMSFGHFEVLPEFNVEGEV
jgi:hypothetical protein